MTASSWNSPTVEQCLERVSLPTGVKLQTKDYRAEGAYPIVDQGQDLIAGWTDNPEGVISAPLPVIVFGDHTRVFKFVDFPFVRGADGTQLLRPKAGIDPLYFYYACRAIDLPSRGYNRHFTILKEKTIQIPPTIEEQVQIAHVLRDVDQELTLLRKKADVLTKLSSVLLQQLTSGEVPVSRLALASLSPRVSS
ncbi:MAG: restriction endonuclease subunit S [Labilithrix sp.]|nr:restriction endonuclease subunit S [Labilithrix sp.]MCW5812695.1 restriction endonuclease subunit S [Labilithrix sp.]